MNLLLTLLLLIGANDPSLAEMKSAISEGDKELFLSVFDENVLFHSEMPKRGPEEIFSVFEFAMGKYEASNEVFYNKTSKVVAYETGNLVFTEKETGDILQSIDYSVTWVKEKGDWKIINFILYPGS